MLAPKTVIGIDLGTESVKTVALEVGRGTSPDSAGEPVVLGVGAALTRGMRKGVIFEPEDAAASVREALEALRKTTGIKESVVFAGVGGLGLGFQKSRGLVVVSRADNEVSKEDTRRAVLTSETNLSKNQNREILHHIPLSFRVDNETPVHDPVGLVGAKLEAETLFITSLSQHVKNVLKAFDAVDTDVEDVVACSYALGNSVVSKREKEAGVMVIDIGAATTSLIIFEEGLPYSVEVIPVGSMHLTYDIAKGFQIPLEEAERVKLNHGAVPVRDISIKKDELAGGYSKRKLYDFIEFRLEDIFEFIEKHLKKVDRAGLLPAGVVIVGGGANLPGVADFAKQFLKLPARIGGPVGFAGMKDSIKDPAWSAATGIALLALGGGRNFPSSIRAGASPIFKWLRAFLP